MAADGRYITLNELKLYGIGAVADPNNPTVYNSAVQGTPDDAFLSSCIHRAEMEFDRICGVAMEQATQTLVGGFLPFVDGNGWLHIFARERVPVTAVTAVQVRDLKGQNIWTTLTFTADNTILPPNTGTARPDSGHVYIIPSQTLTPRATGEILVRWTYTAGYSTIPASLKAIIQRLAWWCYKLREAPMYQVMLPQLGMMQMPMKIPPDIMSDIILWQPVYA